MVLYRMVTLETKDHSLSTKLLDGHAKELTMNWSRFLKSRTKIHGLVSAILTRLLFLVHGFFVIFLVVENKNDSTQWWPVSFLFLLLIESGYTLLVRQGEDYKYFWPSCFFYIMAVLPTIWVMEFDLFNERILQTEGDPMNIPVLNITTTQPTSKSAWGNFSKQTIAEKFGALGLTISIITGRWLLPRGKITRDQLSALLIGYVGIAADILEVFELFDEENLMYNRSVTIATLLVFSWCLLSFCLVTTATTDSPPSKSKVRPAGESLPKKEENKLKEEYIKRVKEERQKAAEQTKRNQRGTGKKRNVEDIRKQLGIDTGTRETLAESTTRRRVPLHGDTYGILTGILMMDGPFLVFRLYCTVEYGVDSEMHIFYLCKNAISLALMVYRLCVLMCKGSDDVDQFYNQNYEDRLQNVQIAVVGICGRRNASRFE